MAEPIAPEHAAQTKGLAAKLQRKVGPFPLWLWIGLAGGAVLLVLRRSGGSGGSTGGVDPNGGTAGDLSGAPGNVDLGAGSNVDQGVPIGDFGGFEDPSPSGFDFGPDPGVSPNPPASDPIMHPILTPELRNQIIAQTYPHGIVGSSPIVAGNLGGSPDAPISYPLGPSLIHSLFSPAARIAAVTTPSSTSPKGIQTLHVSSASVIAAGTSSRQAI